MLNWFTISFLSVQQFPSDVINVSLVFLFLSFKTVARAEIRVIVHVTCLHVVLSFGIIFISGFAVGHLLQLAIVTTSPNLHNQNAT